MRISPRIPGFHKAVSARSLNWWNQPVVLTWKYLFQLWEKRKQEKLKGKEGVGEEDEDGKHRWGGEGKGEMGESRAFFLL